MKNLISFSIFLTLLLFMVSPAQAGPIPTNGDAVVVQDLLAHVDTVVFSGATASFTQTYPSTGDYGFEINNLGYRPSDGLLYGLKLTGSGTGKSDTQLLSIDGDETLTLLGLPDGLPGGTGASDPTGTRFAAGDVGLVGGKEVLYVTYGSNTNTPTGTEPYRGKLFSVDLTDTVDYSTSVIDITGDTGTVFDWAWDPVSGLLYGGDQTNGQLATLNPTTGVRTDVDVSGLPSGIAYGAAWRSADGNIFLYRNSGTLDNIYEIDLLAIGGPSIINTWNAPNVVYNDGASFVPIPVPPAVILGILGLGAAGIKLRKYA